MSNVSEVQISLIKPQDGLIGFASIIIDKALYLSGIGIHQKLDGSGYRLTYPTRKVGGASLDIFHPINREMGGAIEQAVVSKIKEVLSKRNDRHHCAYAGSAGF